MNKLLRLLLALLLVTVLVLGITACGGEDDTTAPAADDTNQTEEHTHTWADATCTAPKTCTDKDCKATEGKALGHTEVDVPGKDASCTETGLTVGKKCSVCGEITKAQTVIEKLAHTPKEAVVENKVDATCSAKGHYDSVIYCAACDAEITRTNIEIDMLEHDWAPATLEAPKTCKVCGATDGEPLTCAHTNTTVVPGKAATCTETGLTDGSVCADCGETVLAQDEIPMIAHDEEVVPGKAATCKETGLTDGSKCKVCGATTVEQTVIPIAAHTIEAIPAVPATCTNDGATAGSKCSVCGDILVAPVVIPAGHQEKILPGKAATCNEPGLTAGKECALCGETLVAQEEIPADENAHAWQIATTEAPKTCAVCGATEGEALVRGEGNWTEYNVTGSTAGIKLLGERNATKASDTKIWLDWAGSGIEMNVRLNVTYDIRIFMQAMTADEGTCAFAVYVDGMYFGNYEIDCGMEEQFIELVNVPAGDHVIRLVKLTDYTAASVEVLMVYMDGEFLETPVDNELYIEFLGDSITTGYTDFSASYAWIVAQAFNADYAITAMNGYGLVNGSAAVGSGSLAADYEKLNPLRDQLAVYRFNREADVVVINLGAEDYAYDMNINGEEYPDAFQAAYEKLLADVRYWNPNAKIICAYGAANDGYADAILAAAFAAGGEDAGIWTVALDLSESEDVTEEGELVIPTAEEQATYAAIIAAKIAEIKDATFGEAKEPVTGEGESQDWNNA